VKTLAIANQKGGVGKTATAHALGEGLAGAGRRVLLVDMDPQSSLSGACGVNDTAGRSMAEVLGGSTPGVLGLAQVIRPLSEGLDLAPSDIGLANGELGLVSRLGRENTLRRALGAVGGRYDLAILDCPPSLGLLTLNALCAADAVLVPTQPQAQDLRGLRLFLATIQQVREALNPDLELLGILVTFYDSRLAHHKEALMILEGAGLPLLAARIGRSVKVAEAAASGRSVFGYAPRNPQALAYGELTQEVDAWLASARR